MSVLKSLDVLVPPVRDNRHKSKFGGCLLILVPILTIIYCYWYLSTFFGGRSRIGLFKMGVSNVKLEVSDWGNRGVEMNLRCISSSGCYYVPPTRTEGDDSSSGCEAPGQRVVKENIPGANYTKEIVFEKQCYFIEKGEMIPKEHSCLIYDSDPFNSFTFSWTRSDRFGVAIESQVFNEECLNRDCPMVTKDWVPLFRGISMLSMVETMDQRDSKQEKEARQFNPTIASSAGIIEPEFNYCFREGRFPDCKMCKNCPNCGAPRTAPEKVSQLIIKPFPSYLANTVQVKYPTEIFGLVGGFVSVLMGVFAGVVYVRLFVRHFFTKDTGSRQNVSPPPTSKNQSEQYASAVVQT